jgi:hypothetical protein
MVAQDTLRPIDCDMIQGVKTMHLIDAYQAAVKEANEKVPEFQDLNPGPAHGSLVSGIR